MTFDVNWRHHTHVSLEVMKLFLQVHKTAFVPLHIALHMAIFNSFLSSSSRFLYLWMTTRVILYVEISILICYMNVLRNVISVCFSIHMAAVMLLKCRLACLSTLRKLIDLFITTFSLSNLKARAICCEIRNHLPIFLSLNINISKKHVEKSVHLKNNFKLLGEF